MTTDLLRRARGWIAELDAVPLDLWLLLTAEGQEHHYPWRVHVLRQLRKRGRAERRYGADRVAAWLRAHPEHDLIFSDYEESISSCLSRLGILMMVKS